MRVIKTGTGLRRFANNVDKDVVVRNGKVYHEGKVIAILLCQRRREGLRMIIEKRKTR